MLVHPLARCEVQYPPHDLQAVIDGTNCQTFLALVFNPGFQSAPMDSVQWLLPDPGHKQLEPPDVIHDAALMLVLQHELCCGLLERPARANAEDLCLPGCRVDQWSK